MSLFENLEEFKKMIEDKNRPFKLIYSGKLHPSDLDGAKDLEKFHHIIENDLKGHAIFMPEYDLDLGRLLTAGCDVWLNTPIVGFEACGTSGMKAALNGSLPVSTLDGWIAEVELLNKGWPLNNDHVSQSFIKTLREEILPLYYDRDAEGVPQNWLANMKNCRELIKNEFSATRMLREYIEKLYSPLISS